jgi:hypothetical protein
MLRFGGVGSGSVVPLDGDRLRVGSVRARKSHRLTIGARKLARVPVMAHALGAGGSSFSGSAGAARRRRAGVGPPLRVGKALGGVHVHVPFDRRVRSARVTERFVRVNGVPGGTGATWEANRSRVSGVVGSGRRSGGGLRGPRGSGRGGT